MATHGLHRFPHHRQIGRVVGQRRGHADQDDVRVRQSGRVLAELRAVERDDLRVGDIDEERVPRSQALHAPPVDIETHDGEAAPAHGHEQREADVAETDDSNFGLLRTDPLGEVFQGSGRSQTS